MTPLQIVGTVNFLKHGENYSIVALSVDGKSHTFYAFDDVKAQLQNTVSLSNVLDVNYCSTESYARKGEMFNKIKYFTNVTPQVLTGTITNTNNVRAQNRHPDYVYLCLKQETGKVSYIYMHKQLAESQWFKKGQQVQMECSFRHVYDGHKVYEAKSLFRYN